MKKMFTLATVLACVAAGCGTSAEQKTTANPSLTLAQGGAGVGNGGDRYALEFVSLAQQVLDELNSLSDKDNHGFKVGDLLVAVARTTVVSTDESLVVDGFPKDAENFPDATPPRIEVNRAGWNAQTSAIQKRRLVLHEYLGIMRVDDSRYQISSKLYVDGSTGINPCAPDEENVRAQAIAKFVRSGHTVTEDNIDVENSGMTVDGTQVHIVRGYEISEGHSINALLYAAQCNSRTGKYEEFFYSGSGASLDPSCGGPARRFCTAK